MSINRLNKGLVIYADDDADDLFLVSEGFFAYAPNIDLITVRNGAELLDCLATLRKEDKFPCLIILDVNMPKMDGKTALRQIRQMPEYLETPAVLFTTSSSPTDVDFADKYNAGFITKPRSFMDMDVIIEQFFHRCTEEVRKAII